MPSGSTLPRGAAVYADCLPAGMVLPLALDALNRIEGRSYIFHALHNVRVYADLPPWIQLPDPSDGVP